MARISCSLPAEAVCQVCSGVSSRRSIATGSRHRKPAYSPSIFVKVTGSSTRNPPHSTNLWRLDSKSETTPQGPPVRVTSTSRGINYRPSLSSDGKKIALESDRLGYSDIWYCDNDGFSCARLILLHGQAGTARVSPDGHYVVLEFRRQEREEIYVVEPLWWPASSGAHFPRSGQRSA